MRCAGAFQTSGMALGFLAYGTRRTRAGPGPVSDMDVSRVVCQLAAQALYAARGYREACAVAPILTLLNRSKRVWRSVSFYFGLTRSTSILQYVASASIAPTEETTGERKARSTPTVKGY